MSKTSTAVKSRWNKKNYDCLKVYVAKGTKDRFRAACTERGLSMNAALVQAIQTILNE